MIRPFRALATVAVFAAFLVAGNALGKDERSEPPPVTAKTSAVSIGSLRLAPAAKLPALREVRRERPTPRRPSRAAVVADAPPAAESSAAESTAPAPVIESPPTYTPQPQSPTPNTVESAPEPAAPAPDPAPSPAPAPSPDPSPDGGP